MEAVAGFPRYDEYKDSGVEWIGEIPAHWAVKRNKQLFREKKETVGKNAADYTLLSLTLKGVIARDMENPQGKFPAEFDSYKVVSNRDLIFCLFDIEETPRTVGMAHQGGMITGAYTVLECAPDVSERYLSYLYLSLDNGKHLKPLYTGLRKVIQRDTFMAVKTPIPPKKEQDRIANFLDQKTTEIDAAIAKKQRLIELLKEQKAILINQAVTQGLDPNVPMRDSGVEWIGQVPEHWEVMELKYLVEPGSGIQMGPFGSMLVSLSETPTLYALYGQKNTISGDFSCVSRWLSETQFRELKKYTLHSGDIVTTRKGSIGNCRLVPENIAVGVFDSDTIRIRVLQDLIRPEFITLLLHEAYYLQETIYVNRRGAVLSGLNTTTIAKLKVAFPRLSEQDRILKSVDCMKAKYDSIIQRSEEQITNLRSFKASLISEAVTGKIKL